MTADGGSPATMITDMLDLGFQLGRDMLAAFRSDLPATRSLEVIRRGVSVAPLTSMLPAMQTCGCEIPPPCWMPQDLGRVVSHGCPGAKAKVRLRISNCGLGTRSIYVEASGAGSGQVTFDPESLSLGTFEEGAITATLTIPDEGGAPIDTLLWVRGCRDHVLRWRIDTTEDGCSSLHEIDIRDCPDLVHHWYDHFYCPRPCLHGDRDPKHG